MQERNVWVDYAKAIGIILVVYGHVARGVFNAGLPMDADSFELVDSIIYSFHMPLFFFLSGLFFYSSLIKRGKAGLMFNKIDTVAYPFIVWSLLQGLIEVVLSRYTNGQVTVTEVFSLLWMPRAQFWFLYALFFVFLLCTFVYARVDKRYFLPLLLVFSVFYVLKDPLTVDTISRFLLANTVFFALGIWFNEIKNFFEERCVGLTLFFGGLFMLGQFLFHVTYGLRYEVGGLPTLTLATISILFMVSLCMVLGRVRFKPLLFIGTASMTIYLMHILAGSGIRVALSKFLGIDSIAVHLVLGTIVGIAAPLLAQWVIERFNWSFLLTAPKPMSASRLGVGKAIA